jgi:hypothetical protein
MAKEKESKKNAAVEEKAQLIAKKDFRISHNGYDRPIKAGEDLSADPAVPEIYHQNLKTEGVI